MTLPLVPRCAATLLLFAACAPPAQPLPRTLPSAPPPVASVLTVAGPPAKAAALAFVEEDLAGATAKARREGRVLFVEAWAPWCHTCLSMKRYVFTDPSLAPLAERAVFVALDTDRPENAAFLERHAVKVWPTFFVLDPAKDAVLGLWPGGASAGEVRAFVEEALVATTGDVVAGWLAEARRAQAAGDLATGARAYEIVVHAWADRKPPGWSAALLGLIQTRFGRHEWAACVQLGEAHLSELQGAAVPADFTYYLLQCAAELPAGPEQAKARAAARSRLEDLTARPPEGASTDDRADALEMLAEVRELTGDPEGVRAAHLARLALLEAAAKAAASPELAQTFDYARAASYVALGRGDEAARMLEERVRQFPDAYEPAARLAGVLAQTGHPREALVAVERAIALAYGPRRLRYLKLRAELLGRLGDRPAEVATLRDEVSGYEALPPGQANPGKLAEARRRLDEALGRGASSGSPPPVR